VVSNYVRDDDDRAQTLREVIALRDKRIDELEAECNQFSETWDKQQAEIRRLNAVLDRLGDEKKMVRIRSNDPIGTAVQDYHARIEYARTRGDSDE
jgi:septal ring factor EnvC (AmiA/AmiB activator)